MPKLGYPLFLNVELWDGATDMFVLAYVRDENDVEVPGSPVICSHVGHGLYTNSSLVMLDTRQMKATYEIFKDALHTVISPDHSNAIDVFDFEETAIQIAGLGTDLAGVMDAGNDLSGAVDGLVDLGANVFGDVILNGTIETGDVSGVVEESEISGNVVLEESTTGEVKC